ADGRNIRIDIRWAGGSSESSRTYARELVALAPDVLVAPASLGVMALQQTTRTVPIVFTFATDPVGAGFVDNLARPGGNTTGFMQFEYSLCGKWVELLKQIAPSVTRAAVVRDPANPSGSAQFAVVQAVASLLGVGVSPVGLRDIGEIEHSIADFARSPNGGLIVTGSGLATSHRNLIVMLAARHKLPAV